MIKRGRKVQPKKPVKRKIESARSLEIITAPKIGTHVTDIIPVARESLDKISKERTEFLTMDPKNPTIVVINASIILEPKNGNIIVGGGKTIKGGRDNLIFGGDVSSPLTCDTIVIGNTAKDSGDHTITINVSGVANRGFYTNSISYGNVVDILGYTPSGNGKQVIASSSSRRFRTNETILERMPDVIDSLTPMKSKWKDGENIATPGEIDVSLIAEDVIRIWPQAVSTDDEGRVSNVRYGWILMLLLKEVQYLRSVMKKWGMKDERV